LRFAFSVSVLAPVFNGLCLFQVFMLLCVGYSVNFANFIWGRGVGFFAESGGQAALEPPQSLIEDSEALGASVLKSLTIQEYFRSRLDMPPSGGQLTESYFPTVGNAQGQMILTFGVPSGGRLAPGDLGRVRVPCQTREDELCQARVSAAKTLVGELTPVAQMMADLSSSFSPKDGRELAQAVSRYEYSVTPYLERAKDSASEKLKADLAEFKETAASSGWLSAGAYYWNISRLNERSRLSLYQGAVFSEGAGESLAGEVLEDYPAVMARLSRYLAGAYSPERGSGAGVKAEFPSAAWLTEKMGGALGRYGLDRLVNQLRYGDPVATMASLGHFLAGAAEVVIGVRVAAMSGAYAAGETSSSVVGQMASVFTGAISSAAAGVAQGAVLGLGPYMLMLSVILISYGFFLAYFLPALPFILWMGGVLGWLCLVVEAVVAAPLWVAAHALPEGEGLAGNSGRQGYLIFLGVLLRPPLMVLGFFIAMTLLTAVGRIIGSVFSVFGFSYLSETFLGVSGFMAFSVITGAVVVTAVWKLFGLMSSLPDRAVSWIGAHIPHQGEGSQAQRSQGEYGAAGAVSTQALGYFTRAERGRAKPAKE
jgi:conjugal transfer/type IV secretion protein DotA/TraY